MALPDKPSLYILRKMNVSSVESGTDAVHEGIVVQLPANNDRAIYQDSSTIIHLMGIIYLSKRIDLIMADMITHQLAQKSEVTVHEIKKDC